MTISEHQESLRQSRKAAQDKMNEVAQKSMDEGRSMNDGEQQEFDSLRNEVDSLDQDIKRFSQLETMEAEKAVSPQGEADDNARQSVQPEGGRVFRTAKNTEKLEPGIAFARVAKVKALARLDGDSVREKAKELYGEDSPVYGVFAKAKVSAATTDDATWAGPLVGDETSAFADFVEYLRPQTILGRFGSDGVPSLRQVPFRVPLVGQTSGGQGYWVGEGKAKPLTSFDFERKTLEPLKVANIAVVTEETLRASSPSAEAVVRDQLAAALRARLDTDFIDPAKSATANVSPGSITNGVTPVISSGNTADDIRADIKALFGSFISANNAPTSGVWIMPATIALSLSLMQNPLGQSEFPGISMNGGTLFGLPVIVSQYVPTDYEADPGGSAGVTGAVVALVNASDVYFADDGGIAVDMSREASLEMSGAPTGDSTAGTGASLVSMWQTNSVAFRAERTLNWMSRRDSAVAVLGNVAWGG